MKPSDLIRMTAPLAFPRSTIWKLRDPGQKSSQNRLREYWVIKHRSNIIRPDWARVAGSREWLSMQLAGLMKVSTSTKIQNFQYASQRLNIAVTVIIRQGLS